MKTKYILAGGNDRASSKYWDELSKAIGELTSQRVLSCFFAQPREDWEAKFDGFDSFFKLAFGDNLIRELAFPEKFIEQVSEADIVYLHGGDDELLAHYMDNYQGLAEMFSGKVIIGSSAGADFLSKQYWTCDWRQARTGSGLTSLNIIVHYGSDYGKDDPRGPIDWADVEASFAKKLAPDESITQLPEGTFVVFEK